MRKLFAYLRPYWKSVLAIVALLVVQAFCDLSLPTYTSDIVDVGIQQSGISQVAPEQIRADSLEKLMLFMEDDQIALVQESYQPDENGDYQLGDVDTEQLDALNEAFALPMVMVLQAGQSSEMDLDALQLAVENGMVSRNELLDMMDEAVAEYGITADSSMV